MKIIFFGSSQFSIPSLEMLLSTGHSVLAVVTAPDKKRGRGQKLQPNEIKELALKKNLPVLQPRNPNEDEIFLRKLRGYKADVFVVVSYGYILNKTILDMPLSFAINLHPSLLPKYRGAAPVNWALINGDEKTGVSVIKMTGEMDAGPVIVQREEKVLKEDNAVSLGERLARKGAGVLVEALKKGTASFLEQREAEVSFAPKFKKEDGLIDFNLPAEKIHNQIRGMLGWPSAFSFFNKKRIEFLESDFIEDDCARYLPSQITEIEKERIKIKTGKGILIIKKVKPEGKKEMSAGDFARGQRLKKGDSFGEEKSK